jgi:hypothetical protein
VRLSTGRWLQQWQLQEEQECADDVALVKVKTLTETLEVPLAEVAELLVDDCKGYMPPAALTRVVGALVALGEGLLLIKSIVDAYIAAMIKL